MRNENKYKPGSSQYTEKEREKNKKYPEKNQHYSYKENSPSKPKDPQRNKYPYGFNQK